MRIAIKNTIALLLLSPHSTTPLEDGSPGDMFCSSRYPRQAGRRPFSQEEGDGEYDEYEAYDMLCVSLDFINFIPFFVRRASGGGDCAALYRDMHALSQRTRTGRQIPVKRPDIQRWLRINPIKAENVSSSDTRINDTI